MMLPWKKLFLSKKPIGRYLLLAVLLILAILAAALFNFLRYQPALGAAPGYTMHHVTDPGWLNGRFKTLQAIVEYVPCTYTLLGWQGRKRPLLPVHLRRQGTSVALRSGCRESRESRRAAKRTLCCTDAFLHHYRWSHRIEHLSPGVSHRLPTDLYQE